MKRTPQEERELERLVRKSLVGSLTEKEEARVDHLTLGALPRTPGKLPPPGKRTIVLGPYGKREKERL